MQPTVYLTCSKKLTGSQLSPPQGTNKKLKCETKNKPMSVIGPPVPLSYEGSPVGERSLRLEVFVEKCKVSINKLVVFAGCFVVGTGTH